MIDANAPMPDPDFRLDSIIFRSSVPTAGGSSRSGAECFALSDMWRSANIAMVVPKTIMPKREKSMQLLQSNALRVFFSRQQGYHLMLGLRPPILIRRLQLGRPDVRNAKVLRAAILHLLLTFFAGGCNDQDKLGNPIAYAGPFGTLRIFT